MQRRILNRFTDAVIWEGEAETVKDAIHAAMKSRANLSRANLSGADLSWANLSGADLSRANLWRADLSRADLSGANNMRLPTGETWMEYITETVPALLTAGGKALESFAPHFACHSWDNCPMAHAFDGHDLSSVPLLLRPRAEQFIQLFDARQIPWPLPTRAQMEAAQAERMKAEKPKPSGE